MNLPGILETLGDSWLLATSYKSVNIVIASSVTLKRTLNSQE